MKKIFIIISLIFLGSFSLASAHELKTDGSISVVFHTNPDDDPGVNEVSDLIFYISDQKNQFNISKCDCTLTIFESAKKLLSEKVIDDKKAIIEGNIVSIPFVFPAKDAYTVTLAGTPQASSSFQSFKLSYDVRVQREENSAIPLIQKIFGGHNLHILLFGIGIIIVAIMVITDIRNRRKEI